QLSKPCSSFSNGPPTQNLAEALGKKQPVIRYFVCRLCIGFDRIAVVEVVAVDLHGMVGIEFRRHSLSFFLVAESRPTALSVPVLANLFPIVELDFHLDGHYEVVSAMHANVGLIHRVVFVLISCSLLA